MISPPCRVRMYAVFCPKRRYIEKMLTGREPIFHGKIKASGIRK